MIYSRSVLDRTRYAAIALVFFGALVFFTWKYAVSASPANNQVLLIVLVVALFDALLAFNYAKLMIWRIGITGSSIILFSLIGPGKRIDSVKSLITINAPYRDLVLWKVLVIKHEGGEAQIPGIEEFEGEESGSAGMLKELEKATKLKIIQITGSY
jgi:hypothetical protein